MEQKMKNYDFIMISQSEMVNYEKYAKLPLDRLDIYKNLIYPRMVYYKGGFRSQLDVLNYLQKGEFWTEVDSKKRRDLLSIWNLPGFVGPHIANYMEEFGISTYVINNFDAQWDTFCEIYEQCDPKPIVGISTTFYLNYSEIVRLAKKMNDAFPGISICLGGAFVNGEMYHDDPKALIQAMRKHKIDFTVHSFNSENDLRDLVLANKNGRQFSEKVNNLIYRSGDNGSTEFEVTQKVWNKPILEEIPANWDKLDLPFIKNTIQMRTSSGCPFSCSFCSYPETAGGFYLMPVETVEKHIQSVVRRKEIKNIIFLDDTFNVPIQRFKKLCKMFCKYDFEWFSFLRVQYVDEELAQLMKDSGCRGVYLGVESANDQVLTNMNKKATHADFERGVKLLNKYEITMMAAFIVGFPGETLESLEDTKVFIESNGIQFYTLKEFYYMENTSVHKDREKYGLTGMGAKWSHDTMDSMQASEHKMSMFQDIKSVFIDPDTSLWYLAYLYDQGLNMSQIEDLQKDINQVIKEQINGKFDDDHPALSLLSQKLKNIDHKNE